MFYRRRTTFSSDFKRFFLRGLAALLPTLVTLFVLAWIWNQLHERLGAPIMAWLRYVTKWLAVRLTDQPPADISRRWDAAWSALPEWAMTLLGVLLAFVLVYIVGLLVGNLIGRSLWRLIELGVMKIPFVRAIYPAAKQVTDFLLDEKKTQFSSARAVAVQHRDKDVWSVGLITGSGVPSLTATVGEEMVTVFIPSTPTAVAGYVVVVPKRRVVLLDMKAEDVLRMLVTAGVVSEKGPGSAPAAAPPGLSSSASAVSGVGELALGEYSPDNAPTRDATTKPPAGAITAPPRHNPDP